MTSRWIVCTFALLLGCSSGEDEGNASICSTGVCRCTEAGIRAAIAEGGGPFTFDCEGPTTVTTEAEIEIGNDVILDGGGNLTVDGSNDHPVFSVSEGATVELHGFVVTRGRATAPAKLGAGIHNEGHLMVTNTSVSENRQTASDGGGGIGNRGTLNLSGVTISGDRCDLGSCGVWNEGTVSFVNSTVSEAGCAAAVCTSGTASLEHSTVVNPERTAIDLREGALVTVKRSIVKGGCSAYAGESGVASFGGNVESPGDTCRLNNRDRVNVSADALRLDPLADNGGATQTHALLPGSVAIDTAGCSDELTTDQRGVERELGLNCDSGAFEFEPDSDACLRNGWRSSDPEAIEPIVQMCEVVIPEQPNACDGDEPTDNPEACVPSSAASRYGLTRMRVTRHYDASFDLDGCDGLSCVSPVTAGDGTSGTDNALLFFDDLCLERGCTPYDLGNVDQVLHDGICAGEIDLELEVAAGAGCALVAWVVAGEPGPTVPMHLSDDGCLSGTLGSISIGDGDFEGMIDNVVLRATVSAEGFSDGVLGGTTTVEDTGQLWDTLIPGIRAILQQFYDINDDLSGDWQSECSAFSIAFEIGGMAIPTTPPND